MRTFLLLALLVLFTNCRNSNEDFVPVPEPQKYENEVYSDYKPLDKFEIPNDFSITEDFISVGTDMTLSNDNGDFGKVIERTFSFGKTFELYDNQKNIQATAKEEMFSFGVEIKIFDNKGLLIGSMKEEIFESIFSVKSIYSIYDKNEKQIGKSKKLNFISTDVEIFDNSGSSIITIHRPAINLVTDKWEIKTNNNNNIDKRLFIFIAAYKTSADNEKE